MTCHFYKRLCLSYYSTTSKKLPIDQYKGNKTINQNNNIEYNIKE